MYESCNNVKFLQFLQHKKEHGSEVVASLEVGQGAKDLAGDGSLVELLLIQEALNKQTYQKISFTCFI